jgi:hypothetical protein
MCPLTEKLRSKIRMARFYCLTKMFLGDERRETGVKCVMGRNGCFLISDKELRKQRSEMAWHYWMNEGDKIKGKCLVLATTDRRGRATCRLKNDMYRVHYGKWSLGDQIAVESDDVQIHEELAQWKTSVFCSLILLLRIFSFDMCNLNIPCIGKNEC